MKITEKGMEISKYIITIEGIDYFNPNTDVYFKLDSKAKPHEEHTTWNFYCNPHTGDIHYATRKGCQMGGGFFEQHFRKQDIKKFKEICRKAKDDVLKYVEKGQR